MRKNFPKLKIFSGLLGILCLLLVANVFLIKPLPMVVHKGSVDPPIANEPAGFHTPGTNTLCLSGGGFRAALFDIGALWRLNELGALHKVDFISSVSGGSLVAAYLVLHWRELNFDSTTGVAANFPDVIADPFLKLTTNDLVRPSLEFAALTRQSVAQLMAREYSRLLFKDSTLSDLPDFRGPDPTTRAPRLIMNATRLEDGSLWTFGQDGITAEHWPTDFINGQLGDDHKLPISTAVAASAAFPPFLAPLALDVSRLLPTRETLRVRYREKIPEDDPDANEYVERYVSKWIEMSTHVGLVDGGVLNNGATAWCQGPSYTVTISAAVPAHISPVSHGWPYTLLRVIDDMYDSKELANQQLTYSTTGFSAPPVPVSLQSAPHLSGYLDLLQRLQNPTSELSLSPSDRVKIVSSRKASESSIKAYARSSIRVGQLASVETDLSALPVDDQNDLVNLGYLMMDYEALIWIMYPGPARPDYVIPVQGIRRSFTAREQFSNFLGSDFKLPRDVPDCLASASSQCSRQQPIFFEFE